MSNQSHPVAPGIRPGIVIHGGAGTILRSAMNSAQEQAYLAALDSILRAAEHILAAGGSAIDAVTEAVRLLEDCPLFNAGKGSVYTCEATHELDAAIMDGATQAAGAVACVSTIRNPILAARAVMEKSAHVLLVGSGAESFAGRQGLDIVAPGYFHTEARYTQWQNSKQQATSQVLLDHDAVTLQAETTSEIAPIDPDNKFGTVGAVALDRYGNLAAATSTGGMTNKQVGRVGDSPILGAGCYANNRTAALSATGTGESFMRSVALYDISAQMEYAQRSLQQAAENVVMHKLPQYEGRGGVIAIDAHGNISMPFNTEGMYRGFMHVGEQPVALIYG
ncbi:MAG TPA: isoaspartyl peptidase/L-asparaginase [Undibacterium sp.]|nr:isoaspartyl peptidase/L-asparaginase [Undibacterium sp.]HTD03492.1 isoaspartyl peptidase/L-asparaginase [Undibacterium sp.]